MPGKFGKPSKGHKFVFAKKVKHPGTAAQPFLTPALDEVGRPILKREIAKALKNLTDLRSLTRLLDVACLNAAAATSESAKQKAPVDKGALKRSINFRRRSSMKYTVGTNIEYASAVEFGTKARTIVPVNKKVLRFQVKST